MFLCVSVLHGVSAGKSRADLTRRVIITGPIRMKPMVLAMIICDFYYRDMHTGKSILSGTFSSINCVQFPSKHGNCAIYIALSDVAVDGNLQLTFKKEDGDFFMELPAWEVQKPESRRTVIEIGGNINGLPIPEEGYYEFIVSWNGSHISSRRLKVNKIELNAEHEPDFTNGNESL